MPELVRTFAGQVAVQVQRSERDAMRKFGAWRRLWNFSQQDRKFDVRNNNNCSGTYPGSFDIIRAASINPYACLQHSSYLCTTLQEITYERVTLDNYSRVAADSVCGDRNGVLAVQALAQASPGTSGGC